MGQRNEPSKAAWKEGVQWVLNLRGKPLSPKTLYRIPILGSPLQEADAFTQILAPLPTRPLEAPANDFMPDPILVQKLWGKGHFLHESISIQEKPYPIQLTAPASQRPK